MGLLTFDPSEARFAAAQRRIADAYARAPGSPPAIFEPLAPESAYTVRELLDDFDKMLAYAADRANALARLDHDFVPLIDTFCSVGMAAEAFGCQLEYQSDYFWARPAVSSINEVWSLKPLQPRHSPLLALQSKWIDYAQRKLGPALPVWTMDLQSPFNVAEQIVGGEALFCAMCDEPKAVHHLLQMVTDYSIGLMHEHLRQMEHPGFPGKNFPCVSRPIGVVVPDDTAMIMLGAQQYREFSVPYLSQIGREFGGIHIHCCGNYAHNLDNLLAIENLRSVQMHVGPGEFLLPATPDEDHPFNRARQKVALLIDSNSVSRADPFRDRPRDLYEQYLLPRVAAGGFTGCVLQSCGAGQGIDAQQALRWTRSRVPASG